MEIIVMIDGRNVKMNPFVTKILSNIIMAAVNSLDLPSDDWKTLEVNITKSKMHLSGLNQFRNPIHRYSSEETIQIYLN